MRFWLDRFNEYKEKGLSAHRAHKWGDSRYNFLRASQTLYRIAERPEAGPLHRERVEVILDIEAPSLGLDEVRLVEENKTWKVWLSGGVFDPSGIRKCRIGNTRFETAGDRIVLANWFDLRPDQNSLEYQLRDGCGNEIKGSIEVKEKIGILKVRMIDEHKSYARVVELEEGCQIRPNDAVITQ